MRLYALPLLVALLMAACEPPEEMLLRCSGEEVTYDDKYLTNKTTYDVLVQLRIGWSTVIDNHKHENYMLNNLYIKGSWGRDYVSLERTTKKIEYYQGRVPSSDGNSILFPAKKFDGTCEKIERKL